MFVDSIQFMDEREWIVHGDDGVVGLHAFNEL